MKEVVQPLAPDNGPERTPPAGTGGAADHAGTVDTTGSTGSGASRSERPEGGGAQSDDDTGVSFADFVANRSQALLRSAYLLTGDVGLAEDLLQTALVKSWRHWKRVTGSDGVGGGEAYVRRALYTTYASWWRRKWRGETPTAAPPDRADDQQHYAGIDDRTELLRALATLPRGQRAVLVLRFFEDRTEAETARILECSTGTVKSQTSRALSRLRSSPIVNALVGTDRGPGEGADQEKEAP